MQTEIYTHHGRDVHVVSALKGRHRDICLCFSCATFTPDLRDNNCPIANRVFAACVDHGLVTPVVECPDYQALPASASYAEQLPAESPSELWNDGLESAGGTLGLDYHVLGDSVG